MQIRRFASLAFALVLMLIHHATAVVDASSAAAPIPAAGADVISHQAEGVNARAAATKTFIDRIAEYVAFHNNVEKMVPPLKETPSPEEIAQREAALGAALIKQRPAAKEGEFFVKVYQPHLVHRSKRTSPNDRPPIAKR